MRLKSQEIHHLFIRFMSRIVISFCISICRADWKYTRQIEVENTHFKVRKPGTDGETRALAGAHSEET